MKTLSTIRMRPKPEHFDLIADKLRDRVDVWATRGTAAELLILSASYYQSYAGQKSEIITLIDSGKITLRKALIVQKVGTNVKYKVTQDQSFLIDPPNTPYIS